MQDIWVKLSVLHLDAATPVLPQGCGQGTAEIQLSESCCFTQWTQNLTISVNIDYHNRKNR